MLALLVACSPQSSVPTKLPEKLFKASPLVSDVEKIKKGCYLIRHLTLQRKKRKNGTFWYFIPKRVKKSDGSLSPEVIKRHALLDTCPSNENEVDRPMIIIEEEGEMKAKVFDLIKVFETSKEAIEFAKRNYLKDIQRDQVQE